MIIITWEVIDRVGVVLDGSGYVEDVMSMEKSV